MPRAWLRACLAAVWTMSFRCNSFYCCWTSKFVWLQLPWQVADPCIYSMFVPLLPSQLYSQLAISLFMSQSSKTPRTPIAYWSDEETEALLKHFLENQSVNEGAGGFNNTVFQSVISATQPFYRRGAIENIKHIKGKWWLVSLCCSDHTMLTSHQLKAVHMSIPQLQGGHLYLGDKFHSQCWNHYIHWSLNHGPL